MVNKKLRILLAGMVVSIGTLTGCIEHRPPENTVKEKKTAEEPEVRKRALKGLRVYEGVIPCADCSGIYQRLALKGDTAGVFRLTETYRNATEDGDGVVVTTGSWKRYSLVKGGEPKTFFYYLSEGSLKDSSRIQRYQVVGNRIVQLDLNGQTIDSNQRYTLKLIAQN